jgi:hypothetical protein
MDGIDSFRNFKLVQRAHGSAHAFSAAQRADPQVPHLSTSGASPGRLAPYERWKAAVPVGFG